MGPGAKSSSPAHNSIDLRSQMLDKGNSWGSREAASRKAAYAFRQRERELP